MTPETACAAHHARYPHAVRVVTALLALAAVLVFGPRSVAQDAPGDPDAPLVDAATAPVSIAVDSFGVGGTVRAGDWAGVRLTLTLNTSAAALPVAVRLHIDDIDGDTALYQRVVTLTGGVAQPVWVYAPLPPGMSDASPTVFTVTIHEVVNDGSVVGRQIEGTRIATNTVVKQDRALMAVVGQRSLGLESYELNDGTGEGFKTSNEFTTVVSGLNPADLPDSWVGLTPYRLILWAAGDPARLTAQQAEAITGWVERGGHLVITLPAVGEAWFDDANPLRDVVPLVEAERVPAMDYARVRSLLTRSFEPYASAPLPIAPAWVLIPRADASPAEASLVATGPDGGLIARRAVSTGLVTLIGLDIARRDVAQALRAEVFWHAITGDRFDIPTPEQLNDNAFGNLLRLARNSRGVAYTDEGSISEVTNRARTAGAIVLLALIVFIAYWVLAGPGGYGLLRWRNSHRLAWPAFVLATAAFTVVAWVGARTVSPSKADTHQLDVFTSVYGTRGEHARSWISLLLPTYGDRRIEIRDGEGGDALSAWSSPGDIGNLQFPDSRSYVVDSADLHAATIPARGTVKQLRAEWLGASRWNGLEPSADAPPRLVRNSQNAWALTGGISHGFPETLEEVQIVVSAGLVGPAVRRKRKEPEVGPLPVLAWAVKLDKALAPGEVYDLSGVELTGPAEFAQWADTLNRATGGLANASLPKDRDYDRINWFGSIPPPNYRASAQMSGDQALVRRRDTHGLDLSAWLTQPVIIVTGKLETSGTDGPSPLLAPDDVPAERRVTLVRWIYPLEGEGVLFNEVEDTDGSDG